MPVKTTGAEWNAFYADASAWPDGWFHEDEVITVDGAYDEDRDLTCLQPDSKVTVTGGIIFKGDYSEEGDSVEGHFRKWRKAQTNTTIVVTVPNENLDALRQFVKTIGGRVA